MHAAYMFATHPNFNGARKTPGVLLSLRSPDEWARSRLHNHIEDGSYEWLMLPRCLGESPRLTAVMGGPSDRSRVALSVMMFNAWAACLATSPAYGFKGQEHLLMINLFETGKSDAEIDADLVETLSRFLLGPASAITAAPQIDSEKLAVPYLTEQVRACAYQDGVQMNHTKLQDWAPRR